MIGSFGLVLLGECLSMFYVEHYVYTPVINSNYATCKCTCLYWYTNVLPWPPVANLDPSGWMSIENIGLPKIKLNIININTWVTLQQRIITIREKFNIQNFKLTEVLY